MDFFVPAKPKEEGIAASTPTKRGKAGAEKDEFSKAFVIEFGISGRKL